MKKTDLCIKKEANGSGGRGAERRPALLILLLLCIAVALTGCVKRKVYSNSGKDELDCFARLGVFPAGSGDALNDQISRFDAVLALQRLLGAGDEMRIADYFRTISYSGTVDFFEDASGAAAASGDTVSAIQAYTMCLKALGYGPELKEGGEGSVTALASQAGFGSGDGSGSGLLTGNKITYGTYSLILWNLMLLRPQGSAEAVYRIAAMMDSGFSDLLEYNGLYDDIPEELCPLFCYGQYVPASFSAAVSEGKREWAASYIRVSEADIASYAAELSDGGWTLEGKYIPEKEQGSIIWLYYKAEAAAPDGEMGLVLKFTADGMLSWNLMA